VAARATVTVIATAAIIAIMTTATAAKAPIVKIAYVTQAPAARPGRYTKMITSVDVFESDLLSGRDGR
jgi:hypothetical protein